MANVSAAPGWGFAALCGLTATELQGNASGSCAGFHAKLREDVFHVLMNRMTAEAEHDGDFAISLSLGDPEEHFAFTGGEAVVEEA